MSSLKFDTHIDLLAKLKLHYLLIPSAILTELNKGKENGKFNKRVIVKVNDAIEWRGGIVALGEGNGYVTISVVRMKQLGVEQFDEVRVEIKEDSSEIGHDMPDELLEIFRQHPDIEERFNALTPGKKRAIIYNIIQVKSIDKRLERCWFFINNLIRLPQGNEPMSALFNKE